jgi:hypothetical protein
MFVTPLALQGGRRNYVLCKQDTVLKQKRAIEDDSRRAREVTFFIKGVPIDNVRNCVYLRCKLSSTDEDWPYVHKNLAKSRSRWALVPRVLIREGANSRMLDMFYKAVAQTVLIFGSESWVVTEIMLKTLEVFHRQIACHLEGRYPAYLSPTRGTMGLATHRRSHGRSGT